MKFKTTYWIFVLLGLLILSPGCFLKDKIVSKKLKNNEDAKRAYIFGYTIGSNAKKIFKDKETQNIVLVGILDSIKGKDSLLSQEEIDQLTSQTRKPKKPKMNPEEEKKAMEQGKKFLEENSKKPNVKTTASGLQYIVLKEGKGESPKATDKVEVHYRGTLIDGTEFDSSYKRNKSISFPLNGVIKGWTEGLQLMKEGAKYKFFIPSELAYGAGGAGGSIPPHATLIFEVELIKVSHSDSDSHSHSH